MKGYVENHLWSELEVTSPKALWVARVLLRIPSEFIDLHRRDLPSLIYRVYWSLRSDDDSYVTKYNASRADLIAHLIAPTEDEGIIRIGTEPEEDLSYWLCSHVLGFNDTEISVLCDIPVGYLDNPGRDLLPLLKVAYHLLRKIKLNDPIMQHYHRSRHLMIQYFLDAHYHEIS